MLSLLLQFRDEYMRHARGINLTLLIACIAGLTTNMLYRWKRMMRRTRRIFIWIYLIFLNLVYGYTIAIKRHLEVSHATVVFTGLFLGLFLSLVWHPKGDDEHILNDNSLGTRFVTWLDTGVRVYKARRGGRHKMDTPGKDEEVHEVATDRIPPEPDPRPDSNQDSAWQEVDNDNDDTP